MTEQEGVSEVGLHEIASMTNGGTFARIIDEDVAHHASGESQKAGTVEGEPDLSRTETNPGFMDNLGGLECMAGALVAKEELGAATQLFVDRFKKQSIIRTVIASRSWQEKPLTSISENSGKSGPKNF